MNVFLIKVTSLPQLIAITIYERHLASGQKLRQTSRDAAQSFFQSLPRHIKNMPLVEALVGPSNNDLYDAIFDMDVDDDEIDIFAEFDDGNETPILRSLHSRENLSASGSQIQAQSSTLDPAWNPDSNPASPRRRTPGGRRAKSATRLTINPNLPPRGSPRHRVLSALPPTSTTEQKLGGEGYGAVSTGPALLSSADLLFPSGVGAGNGNGTGNGSSGAKSPLARLFSQRAGVSSALGGHASEQMALMANSEANTSVKRIEALLEDVKDLPVNKLKEEMKELQASSLVSLADSEY